MRRFGRWGWVALLAALICCGVMAFLESGRISDAVKSSAESALAGVNLDESVNYEGIDGFDGIGRDGLNVVLEGPAAAEQSAVDAVRARSEIDQVTYRVLDDADPDTESDLDPEEGETSENEAQPSSVVLDAVTISVVASGSTIQLEGAVPDDATRDVLITTAVNEYGAANVAHDIVVDPETVTLDGGRLILRGEAISTEERKTWAGPSAAIAEAAGLEFADRSTTKTVDQALNELFTLEPIEFDINLATIRSRSESTLTAAAELINANPDVGRLRVVGHTDSDGSAEANQQLSEARAQAVVDYLVANAGVAADRLEAEGRGESDLLVDPEVTPQDKQRNRRIAWELVS